MVKRTASTNENEPEQKIFDLPSEKEHLFQVVDILMIDPNPDFVHVKSEVVGGEEEGRTILNRLGLDCKWKGFFATRLFLKAIGEPYKGNEFIIDTDQWPVRQYYATIVHNGKYANIEKYNFKKLVD